MRYVCAATAAVIGLSILVPSRMLGQVSATGLSITNYQLVGQQQISGNQYNYTYRADIANTGTAKSAVTAIATSSTPAIEIIDRTQPVDFSSLQWTFLAPFAVAGPNQTAAVGSTVTLNGSGSSNPTGTG